MNRTLFSALLFTLVSTPTLARASDSDPPESEAAPTAAPASVELAVGLAPSGALGANGLLGFYLLPRIDVAVVLDPRVALVLGASFSWLDDQSTDSDDFWYRSIEVPLAVQIYFDDPTIGAVIPTLRAGVTGAFSTAEWGRAFGGGISANGGATWIAESWLAFRLEVGAEVWLRRSESDAVETTSVGSRMLAQGSVVMRL